MSDKLLKDLIGYHLSNKYTDSYDTNRPLSFSPTTSTETKLCQRIHLSRSPVRPALSETPSPRKLSKSPVPEKFRQSGVTHERAANIVQEHLQKLQSPPIVRKEADLKQKIQALEVTVAEYERQKFNVMGTFQEYRERVAERERKLEAEYSSKIISLSEEVLVAKRDFEERMKQFQALQEKFEREKEGALEKLRQEHQREIQILEQRCSDAQLLNLEQKYMIEIQRLEEERQNLHSEKENVSQAFESRLKRAQALYETELNGAKTLYSNELDALKEHEAALREEMIARQEEFRDRLEGANLQFQQSKEELAKCKEEVIELEKRLLQKEEEVHEITKHLQEARKETDEALAKLQKVDNELECTKQKFNEQQEQLQRKSDMLGVLEQAKSKLETVIQDLQNELKSVRNKVTFLENERQNLESQSRTQGQLQDSQLQALHSVLENMTKENNRLKDHYEQMVLDERATSEEREFKMRKEFQVKFADLEKQRKVNEEHIESRISDARDKLRKELESIYEQELQRLKNSNATLEADLMNLKERSLSTVCSQCAELQDLVKSKDDSLTSATERATELSDVCDKLKADLELLRSKFSAVTDTTTSTDRKSEQCTHEAEIAELKLKLETQTEESLQEKEAAIREELVQKFEADKQRLSKLHEEQQAEAELRAKSEIQALEENYHKEIENLKQQLTKTTESSSRLQQSDNADIINDDAENEHSTQLLNETIDELNETINKLKAEIDNLKQSKSSESATQADAGSLSSSNDAVNAQIFLPDTRLRQELKLCKHELQKCKDVEAQLLQLSAKVDEQDEIIKQKQMAEERLKEEITKLEECRKAIDEPHDGSLKAEELKETSEAQAKLLQEMEKSVDEKQVKINELDATVKTLNANLSSMTKEIEQKNKDMQQLKIETHDYIMKREKQQLRAHKREVEQLKASRDEAVQRSTNIEAELRKQIKQLQQKIEGEPNDITRLDAPTKISEAPNNSSSSSSELLSLHRNELRLLQETNDVTLTVVLPETAKNDQKKKSESPKQNRSERGGELSAPPATFSVQYSPDSLRKRHSIATVGPSQKELQAAASKKAAIVQKWQCLVHQLHNERRRDSDSTVTAALTTAAATSKPSQMPAKQQKEMSSMSVLPAGPRAPSVEKASPNLFPTPSVLKVANNSSKCGDMIASNSKALNNYLNNIAEAKLRKESAASMTSNFAQYNCKHPSEERSSRSADHKGSNSVLSPPDSRRIAKSPSRSPAPRPKLPPNLPISRRPAWRL